MIIITKAFVKDFFFMFSSMYSNTYANVFAEKNMRSFSKCKSEALAKKLVGCFGFNGPLRQYFSLYRAVRQR